MLRDNKILNPFPKINPTFSVCALYQKHNFQQLVLCEHAKSSIRLIVFTS